MATISQIKMPNNTTHDIVKNSFYGTCDTAAATAAKVVTLSSDSTGWSLKAGVIIGVKFTNTNSASSVSLNVNGSGAKSIWYNNAVYTGNNNNVTGYANRINYYMYDGTYWVFLHNGIIDSNTDTKVTQTADDSTASDFEVIFSATADNTTRTEAARKSSKLKFNPSTGNLQATQLNGVTIGSSPKFTDTNTHRPIQVNGTEVLGNNTTALNLKAGSNVSLSNSSGTVTIAATDTTYGVVSTSANGLAPKVTDTSKFLKGDGTWATPTDTNNAVTQTATNTNADYEVLFSATADNTTRTEGARKYSNLKFNPSTGKLTATTLAGNISGDYLSGGYINTHPENSGTVIPFINNDIAYLLKRGGSAVIKYDSTAQTVDISNVFDCSPSYWVVNPTGYTTITIELTLHKTFTYSNTVYVDFGSSSWRAKNVKIEVMNTNYEGDTWTKKYENTNNSVGHCYIAFSHTPTGASGSGGGFNKLRFTFSSWNNATIFRIAQLGIINHSSNGLRAGFLPKDGGEMYGNIYPNTTNGADLGTSSKYWNNAYITNINGVAVGSSPKFTDNDTKNTAGSTDSSSKLFLIGATSQAANPQTYSHDTAYVGTDGCLYSGGTKVLTAHQTIKQDGITGATVNRFGTCSTAAGTAAKTVDITTGTFALEAGSTVAVKFTNANTANSPTLNVNSKGAKNIFVNGAQITSGGNKALLTGTVIFVYDGTQWNLVGNYYDTNTQTVTGVKGNSESSYRTGNVNITCANIGAATSDHTHGNITNGGALQTTDITIASGDKLVVTDSSDSSKVARTSISFDGSTATKCLTQKGTWETFGTSNLALGTTSTTALKGDTKYAGASTAGGAATSAEKLGSSTLGGSNQPIYLSSGTATKCNTFVPNTGGTFNAANGTAGAEGATTITIGNATGAATEKNSYGRIRLYRSAGTSATTAYYTEIRPGANTANRAITFPNAGGTVALTSDIVNNAVTQTATSTNANYEVLFSVTADNTTRTEGARKNSNLKFNPSTGNLTVTKVNGEAVFYSGSVSAAVNATTCTISNTNITTNSMIEPFSSNSSGNVITVTKMVVTAGKVVLTFPALTEATSFKVRITNV